jgi:GT2 family glycosyltransferase
MLAQTYPNVEILVMDDASTDATPEIVASYGARVRNCRQPQNRGIYNNCNDGIAIAAGRYIATYHADDVYLPTIVEREVDFLERNPEAGAVFCQDIFIDSDGKEYARLELPPEVRGGRPLEYGAVFNALLRRKNRFLRCPSNMTRASVYADVGVYRQDVFRNTSDLDMWLRIARKYPVGILEEHLFKYRHHKQSSARRYHHLRTEQERYFKIMDLYLDEGGRALAEPDALAAYEAHRAEDRLMIAVRHYILNQREDARQALSRVSMRDLTGSPVIQRGRLALLFLAMQALVRAPGVEFLADRFHQHWYPDEHRAGLHRPDRVMK